MNSSNGYQSSNQVIDGSLFFESLSPAPNLYNEEMPKDDISNQLESISSLIKTEMDQTRRECKEAIQVATASQKAHVSRVATAMMSEINNLLKQQAPQRKTVPTDFFDGLRRLDSQVKQLLDTTNAESTE